MSDLKKSDLWLLICGLGLLASIVGWTLLSCQFIYGEGHSDRPILSFLILYGLAWLFFVAAFYGVWRTNGSGSLLLIVGIAMLARIILFPSELIQENDVYRYVLDGQVLIHGGNPYEFSPWEVLEEGKPELRSSLGSEEAQQTLQRIGYPQIPTIYPPLAQAVFAGGALIGGWNWTGQRSILLLVDLLTLLTLVPLVDLLAGRRGWIVLYAWNPLLLKEVANSAHLDVLVALWVSLLLLSLIAFQRFWSLKWLSLAAAALAAAVLSKLYPLLLAPAVLVFVWRSSRSWQHIVYLGTVSGLLVLLGFAPFASLGPDRLFRGLLIYANEWRMNEGFFTFLDWFLPNPRYWAAAISVAVAIGLPLWQRRIADPAPGVLPRHDANAHPASTLLLARQFQWVILTWYLVMPTPFPWYAIPLLLLMVISDSLPALLGTLTISGVAALYYLRFFFEYHDFDPAWWATTRLAEHSLIWLALGVGWFMRRSKMSIDQNLSEPEA